MKLQLGRSSGNPAWPGVGLNVVLQRFAEGLNMRGAFDSVLHLWRFRRPLATRHGESKCRHCRNLLFRGRFLMILDLILHGARSELTFAYEGKGMST